MILHLSVWQIVGIAVFLLGQMSTVIDASDMAKELGDAILLALQTGGITVKEACAIQGVDEAYFRKGLRAEPNAHISLTRLVKLPFARFWMFFTPALIYLVAKRHMVEIAEDLGLRKVG